jgi:hypothetical protein
VAADGFLNSRRGEIAWREQDALKERPVFAKIITEDGREQ